MNISTKMQKAIGAFNWAAVKANLAGTHAGNLHREIAIVLDVMLRDGYLIMRRPDPTRSARRDAFLAAFRAFAAAHSADGLFAALAERFEGARLTETVYQEILSSVRTHVLSRLTPPEFVWGVLRQCELHARELIAAINSPSRHAAGFFDPVAGKLHVASAGGDVNPDQFLNSTMRTLTSTIKMLAYELRWFAADGVINIPTPSLNDVLPEEVIRINYFLAEAWSQVERSDGRCRYFGGSVTEAEHPGVAGNADRIKAVRFDFSDASELGMHAAGERVKWMFMNFNRGLADDPGIRAKIARPEPTPLAPDGFVSVSEANGAIALSNILFKWIGEITEEYGGLTIVEWLRGYSFLQKLGTEHLQSSPPNVVALFTPRMMEELLRRAGLSLEKTKVFIRNVTFGKDSDDVFDAPLLRCADGHLFLVAPAATAFHPAFVTMSRLASLRCDLSWKGKTLEGDIVNLFREHGIPAAAIKRKIDGQECEVDCVVLWQDVLFVFECKNYSLPGDNAQAEFWFAGEQASAARQAKTKAEILARHPEVVAAELGVRADWVRVVPVVLNGMPYSLPGPINGVHFYDASALHRFFEEGEIGIRIGDKPLSEKTLVLWAGPRPDADKPLRRGSGSGSGCVDRYLAAWFAGSERSLRKPAYQRRPDAHGCVA